MGPVDGGNKNKSDAHQKKKVIPYDYLVIGEDEKARCKDDTPSVQAEENKTVVTMRDKRK